MNLADYIKCLKSHALNKKISDEDFLNAALKPYIDAGEIDNRNNEEMHLDKSRTSLILNRREDVPRALRRALNAKNIYSWTEENFAEFIEEYIDPDDIQILVEEISQKIQNDKFITDSSTLLKKKNTVPVFLADTMIECIKLKNNGFDPTGEIIRNGAYCVKVLYEDLFKYAFRKRTKEKNIVVIPVDTEFHTHVTRSYEKSSLNEVSAKSIHGQFLTRWEQSGKSIDMLPKRIQDSLKNLNDKTCDENGKWPIGTIAPIENNTAVFYLLAISEFDKNNNAHSTKKKIAQAIEELSIFYDKYGDGYDLYIPLMGTGKSRANISLQEAYDILVDCYKDNKSRLQGNIYI